ncbi:MAG: hypothetical protein NTW86_32075 [Candidatus Sumerlaeota bacterium]|nr:hypothetical protein [Candidatus Sumerlaeota bacterium]
MYSRVLRGLFSVRAARLRHAANDCFGLAATIMKEGIWEELRRRDERARRAYENALALARRVGFRQAVCACEANLGNLAGGGAWRRFCSNARAKPTKPSMWRKNWSRKPTAAATPTSAT